MTRDLHRSQSKPALNCCLDLFAYSVLPEHAAGKIRHDTTKDAAEQSLRHTQHQALLRSAPLGRMPLSVCKGVENLALTEQALIRCVCRPCCLRDQPETGYFPYRILTGISGMARIRIVCNNSEAFHVLR